MFQENGYRDFWTVPAPAERLVEIAGWLGLSQASYLRKLKIEGRDILRRAPEYAEVFGEEA